MDIENKSNLEASILEDMEALKQAQSDGKQEEKTVVDEAVDKAKEEPKDDKEETKEEDKADDNDVDAGADGRDERDDKAIDEEDLADDATEAEKNNAFAKMRIKLKEKDEEIARINADKARAEGFAAGVRTQPVIETKQEETKPDPEPNKDEDKEAWLEWSLKQESSKREKVEKEVLETKRILQMNEAKEEIKGFEEAYKRKDIDYDDAKAFLFNEAARLMKQQQPGLSDSLIKREIEKLEIMNAAKAVALNVDPALHFKNLAVQAGFKAKAKEKEGKEDKGDGKAKPNLEAIKNNKKKSASLIGGAGRGKTGDPSSEELVDMALEDIAKLPDSMWTRIQ